MTDNNLYEFETDEQPADPLFGSQKRHPDFYKTLVLNADYTPVRYFPLSVWPWQKAIKLQHEDVIDVVAYHDFAVHSAHREHPIPSVVALREFVPPPVRVPFTRFNVYLRDLFTCQYCKVTFAASGLTFEHVHPKSKGGRTEWTNISAACHACNLKKGDLSCAEAKMYPRVRPYEPAVFEIREKGRKFPPRYLHESWNDYCYWDVELES